MPKGKENKCRNRGRQLSAKSGKYPRTGSSQTQASNSKYLWMHEIIQKRRENEIPDPYLLITQLQKVAQLICQWEEIISAWNGPKPLVWFSHTGKDSSSAPSSCKAKAAASSIPSDPCFWCKPPYIKIPKRAGLVGWFQTKPELMFPKVTKDFPKIQTGGMGWPDLGLLSHLKVKMKHKKIRFSQLLPAQPPGRLRNTKFCHYYRCKPGGWGKRNQPNP